MRIVFNRKLTIWVFMVSFFLSFSFPPWSSTSLSLARTPTFAGASKVKITPSGQVYLAGFKEDRRSVGVHDDLFARAIVLEKDGTRLTIVSLDLIGLLYNHVKEIVNTVKDIAGENVVIASTHTHSGPDTIGLWGPSIFGIKYLRSGIDDEYMAFLRKEVTRAIFIASSRMVEAEVAFARIEVSGISRNRRKNGVLDRELTVMGIQDVKGKRHIATLVNFACHPEVLDHDNLYVSADFPAYLYTTMERELGGVSLYINGSLGGMVIPVVKKDEAGRDMYSFQEAERIGTTLAMKAIGALSNAKGTPLPWIRVTRKEVAIPLQNFRFLLGKWVGIFNRPLLDNRVKTEVWYIDLGNAKIITVPGEMTPDLGLSLKARLRGKFRFLFGLTNDELGYILPKEDFHKPFYSYERTMSVGPDAGSLLYEGLVELISP